MVFVECMMSKAGKRGVILFDRKINKTFCLFNTTLFMLKDDCTQWNYIPLSRDTRTIERIINEVEEFSQCVYNKAEILKALRGALK